MSYTFSILLILSSEAYKIKFILERMMTRMGEIEKSSAQLAYLHARLAAEVLVLIMHELAAAVCKISTTLVHLLSSNGTLENVSRLPAHDSKRVRLQCMQCRYWLSIYYMREHLKSNPPLYLL